jgi:hypothetical protein
LFFMRREPERARAYYFKAIRGEPPLTAASVERNSRRAGSEGATERGDPEERNARRKASAPHRHGKLFLLQRFALLGQLLQFVGLFSNAIGITVFVAGTGKCGRLLDQLPDIVAHDGDAPVELGSRKRRRVIHGRFLEIDLRL